MIDLHIHSKYSTDGCEEVSNILIEAEKLGIKYISITDHNSCEAYNELKNRGIRNLFSGKIITGVELKTKVLGIQIEVLGYNINPELLQEKINKIYLSEEKRNKIEAERIQSKIIKLGIKLPENFNDNYDGKIYYSKYLHNYIVKDETNKKYINEKAWNNSDIFFREYMSNPATEFYVDMSDTIPSLEETIDIIKASGGMVFLPHIFEYKENAIRILNYILDNYKIDGIECYYRNFSKNETKFLLEICKKNNLYISGGSDYHGKTKPNIKLGIGEGFLSVPDSIIEEWENVEI